MPDRNSIDSRRAAAGDAADGAAYGLYQWFSAAGELHFDGKLLALDGGDLAILSVLVEQSGEAVSRSALAMHMGALVAGSNNRLWSRIAGLNRRLKALSPAAGYIAFHPAQGFSLVLPASVGVEAVDGPETASHRSSRLPARRAPVFGREEAIHQVAAKLSQHRLVTVLGAGGLGKTTLAIATAQLLSTGYADGVSFVDLAPITEPRLLVGTIASAMEVEMVSDATVLINLMRGKHLLLVLDSCEHIVGPVANLVEKILSACPQVHVLATSREPLKSLGERLHRLDPMGLPDIENHLSANEALNFPAIQLFAQAARRSAPDYQLTDGNVASAVALCRQLDGIPLAIELIAAYAPTLGTEALVGQMQIHLLALANPVHRGPERHRTLARMLDWSYGLLSGLEQTVFRRLAIFPRGFHLDAASRVVSFQEDDPDEITETILNLIAKSLLASSDARGHAVLRLLDTSRAYAREKLALSSEHDAVARQHALYVRDVLRDAEKVWTTLPRQEWRRTYSFYADDLRAASNWAFSSQRDIRLSLELALSAVALGTQTTLLLEYDEWANKAVEALPRIPDADPETVIRLLSIPLLLPHKLPQDQQVHAERLNRAIAMSYAADMPELAAAPMIVHFSIALQMAEYMESEYWSREMLRVAVLATDPVCKLIGSRMLAQSLHFQGRYAEAVEPIQYVYANQALGIPIKYYGSYVAMGVSIRIVMARERWIMGMPEQAEELVQQALALTHDDNSAVLCQVYALAAIPIALWRGDMVAARTRLSCLRQVARSFNFSFWQEWETAFSLAVETDGGISSRLQSLVEATEPSSAKMRDHLCTFNTALLGQDTLRRVRAGSLGWCAPEALRSQAEALLQSGDAAAFAPACLLLEEAKALAKQQGALAWELRATMSLARVGGLSGRYEQAHEALAAIYARFQEGHGTGDLRAAASLLAELAQKRSASG